ncbi:30S ribosomal protein S20 [Patescibacteria group bacterium]|nr:MAG: 30S ribosomal protein S20 [Patescibacteria group bacterium]
MPIIKSAIKRAKQTIKRNTRNVGIKRDIKEATKAFLAKPTAASLSAAHSEIDTAVKKKLLKKNTAARRKATLAKIAKDAGVKLSTGKKTTTKAVAAKPAATKAKAAPAKTVAKKPAPKAPAAKKAPAKKMTK